MQERNYLKAMRTSFPECNRVLHRLPGVNCEVSGSTGVVALVTEGNRLVVANLGDSRCLMGEDWLVMCARWHLLSVTGGCMIVSLYTWAAAQQNCKIHGT